MQVRTLISRFAADVPDDLTANDVLALPHGGVIQIGIEGVIAAAVIEQHRREVEAEWTGQAHRARRDRVYRRAHGRFDPDSVTGDARVVRACRRAEGIGDRTFDRPGGPTERGGTDRAGRRGGYPRLRLPV